LVPIMVPYRMTWVWRVVLPYPATGIRQRASPASRTTTPSPVRRSGSGARPKLRRSRTTPPFPTSSGTSEPLGAGRRPRARV